MLEATYKPSMPMVRELLRASLGDVSAEPLAAMACERRGLMTWRRELTAHGRAIVNQAMAAQQAHAAGPSVRRMGGRRG